MNNRIFMKMIIDGLESYLTSYGYTVKNKSMQHLIISGQSTTVRVNIFYGEDNEVEMNGDQVLSIKTGIQGTSKTDLGFAEVLQGLVDDYVDKLSEDGLGGKIDPILN
ncbi:MULTISPECIES: hypothetical protein [Bacillus amyloliquefaciens group]|uniref:hypothetical protein n=1 Tax=Bacillus amyloliquefaciens group TaxID=1938374 RepID=UPI00073B06A5|nr:MULTISPECIES: hypothetical protein [Bacillus amyloliquefaciens group]KTF59871.1 hypothetical protein AR691_14170 [Bacillus amyloliquefaciens]